jgi:hypothetical protein
MECFKCKKNIDPKGKYLIIVYLAFNNEKLEKEYEYYYHEKCR